MKMERPRPAKQAGKRARKSRKNGNKGREWDKSGMEVGSEVGGRRRVEPEPKSGSYLCAANRKRERHVDIEILKTARER